MIHYLKGDATYPQRNPPWILAHIVNDRGGWGRGFVLAVSKRWEEPENQFRNWHKLGEEYQGISFELGMMQLVRVGDGMRVANMLAQHGYKTPANPRPLSYDALGDCLAQVGWDAKHFNATVHMPRIGTGNAGGAWD